MPYADPDHQHARDLPTERHRRRQPSQDERGRRLRPGPDRAGRPSCSFSVVCASTASTSPTTTTATATPWAASDNLVSPRAGIVYKPVRPRVGVRQLHRLLPAELGRPVLVAHHHHRAGEAGEVRRTTRSGVKWEPRAGVALTAALYRLDRTNTRSTDPNDPTRIVQTGSQRTNGVEVGVTGRVTSAWRIAGGYAYQDAFVTSATMAAKAGAQVPQVPHHTLSLWNHYQLLSRLGAAVGHPLPHRHVRDHRQHRHPARLHAGRPRRLLHPDQGRSPAGQPRERASTRSTGRNADSNTNISPGFGRVLRVGLSARF